MLYEGKKQSKWLNTNLILPLPDFGYGCQKYLVRLLTYLPGIPIAKVPLTPQLLYETGKTAARMDKILQEV